MLGLSLLEGSFIYGSENLTYRILIAESYDAKKTGPFLWKKMRSKIFLSIQKVELPIYLNFGDMTTIHFQNKSLKTPLEFSSPNRHARTWWFDILGRPGAPKKLKIVRNLHFS